MRTTTTAIRTLLLGTALCNVSAPLVAQQSVTIYNDGRILVRSTVPSRVPSGNSTHRVSAGFLDAGSVFSLDSAVAIMGASYDAAVDEANTLRRAIGRKLVFETYVKDGVMQTVEAEVLGVERSNLYKKMRAFGIAPTRRGDDEDVA